MNYIILNDVNSNTLTGLIIQNLPPITKPKIRTNTEEIDGRDGDIITKLGYSSYTKEFDIGLSYNYDVDDIIAFFNSEGTVVFSNESDKYYKYTIIEQIDFERLIRFKTAKVKMHVQPFKYSNTDTDIEIYATEIDAEGTNITINNTENGAMITDIQLKGQTEQDGTPTPSSPVNIDVTTGDVTITIANSDSSATQTYTISLGDEELCKIGNYQDYIYYDDGWYIHKEVGKVVWNGTENWTTNTGITTTYVVARPTDLAYGNNNVFYNYFSTVANLSVATQGARIGSSINLKNPNATDLTSFKTWLSTHNVEMYYPSTTPTDTQITDENLIAQLEGLRGASTYINQTNIITSGDLAPIFYGKTYTTESSSVTVTNSGNIYSKPVVTITGIGTINLYLNDYQVFILELGDTETSITIDVENMEAYNTNTNVLMNRYVTGDYSNFLFSPGTNIITWSGTITAIEVTNYSRWI